MCPNAYNNNNNNNNNCTQRRSLRFFLQSPRCAANCLQHVHSSENHVQHIERPSRAICRVVCHLVQRDSSAIKFDRVEISFILALLYWLKPLTDTNIEGFFLFYAINKASIISFDYKIFHLKWYQDVQSKLV